MSKLQQFSEAIALNIEQSGAKARRDDSESARRPAPPAPRVEEEREGVRRELRFKEST